MTWLGRLFEIKNEVILASPLPKMKIGFSIGKKKNVNEDCLRIGVHEEYIYMALTDGHWGYFASEYFINYAVSDLIQLTKSFLMAPERKKHINRAIINSLWNHNKIMSEQSEAETTFLFTLFDKEKLIWISLGDSFLYVTDQENNEYTNKTCGMWFGRRILNKNGSEYSFTSICEIKQLNNWKQIVLMSDGIPECQYGKTTISNKDIFSSLITEVNPVEKLTEKAMNLGGEDNIAISHYKINSD